jgi:hypothetical protein
MLWGYSSIAVCVPVFMHVLAPTLVMGPTVCQPSCFRACTRGSRSGWCTHRGRFATVAVFYASSPGATTTTYISTLFFLLDWV